MCEFWAMVALRVAA